MLHIHKASAGSGKTYTLARTYIKLLLGMQLDDGTFRLRTPKEATGAHSHILAVTFTNKATNEMKQRFVEKLAGLAFCTDPDKTDYMRDLMRDFNAPAEKISPTAHAAPTELLNNYTDFQVSTIDSFFQNILRTFIYEVDLNDNFQLEIDNDFLTRLGVDSTLSLIRGSRPDNEIAHWVKMIMKSRAREGKNWNLLQKEGTAKADLLRFVSEINRENFRKARTALREYFSGIVSFRKEMEHSFRKCKEIVEACASDVKEKAAAVMGILEECGVESHISANFLTQISKINEAAPGELPEFKTRYDGSGKTFLVKAAGKKILEQTGNYDTAAAAASEMYDSLARFHGMRMLAGEFSEAVPYLGIMRETLERIAGFREENNLVQLSEINTILHRIINKDQTPFIYERTGTFLDNFLIDEFQDTSRQQWEIFSPLLEESLSRGNLNLIIGDAKQSIYRFRDADSTLITRTVPSEFPHIAHGEKESENSNYRSARQVVEFNNTLFSLLAPALDNPDAPTGLASVYSSAVQVPANSSREGYVELHLTSKKDPDGNPECMDYVAELVADLLQRGYRQDEIAVLVRVNSQGSQVIDSFVRYNRSIPPGSGKPKIEFISEESLRISGARSVGIILSGLRRIAGSDDTAYSGNSGASGFICDFNWYLAENPDLPSGEILDKYFAGGEHRKSLEEMIASMQSRTLPALVEAIAAYLVPESLREKEAPFIAAFQDKVLDYCDVYPSDIASFLAWWEVNGAKASISAPEGTDAVNIMTIHKSKGLQFRCVIIPGLNLPISPSEQADFIEKQWVEPCEPFKGIFPPLLPLGIRRRLLDTPYAHLYAATLASIRADSLNAFYVAMTRAVDELYVYIPSDVRQDKLGSILPDILEKMSAISGGSHLIERGLEKPEIAGCEGIMYAYGTKAPDPSLQRKPRENQQHRLIGSYYVNPDLSALRVCEEDVPETDGEDPDPRSYGNVRHAVMSRLGTGADVADGIDKALLNAVTRALMSHKEAVEFRELLMPQLDNPLVASWFDPSLKAYNERQLICRGNEDLRPDRIIVSGEGDATVIDYKFGAKKEKSYRRQVAEYMEAIASTGSYRSVSGYIWYVTLSEVERVER